VATYVWTGAVSADITAGANWAGGAVPVGHSDTRVVIGHTPYYPDHIITNWPSGGHLDMEINQLFISPSWGIQEPPTGEDAIIIIGSMSDPLKFSKTKQCTWGGFAESSWDNCPVELDAETYIHMEHWDTGPESTLYLYGHTKDGPPHTPMATLDIWGNPKRVTYSNTRGMKITWNSAVNDISGATAITSKNGPQTSFGSPNIAYPGMGFGFTDCVINLDWQNGANGGNPIKDCVLDLRYSTATISADTWEQGTDTCLWLTASHEMHTQLPALEGNLYTIKSSSAVGTESSALDIPTIDLVGTSIGQTSGEFFENTTKLDVKAGVTIGGQATGTGLNSNMFDIIFSPEAATPVSIESGTIKWRSRIDASELTAGNFTIYNELTSEGVQLVPREGWMGFEVSGPIKIKPPTNANIRIA